MSNYTKSTNFASKDNLSSGNPLKIVKGTEIDTEFNNIATAVATKQDYDSDLAAFALKTAPTGDVVGTSDTQTLTNKTIAYGSNTLTDVVGVTATQTLTNKTLTTPVLTNPTVTNYVESVVAIGTVTSSHTLVLTSGTVQTATLTASTACTFTMPTATAGKSFVLLLKQAASTGNGTATFMGVKFNVGGTPTVTATAGKMDIFTFVADGTNWYGSYSQGYTP
jgi:hypothetical protein